MIRFLRAIVALAALGPAPAIADESIAYLRVGEKSATVSPAIEAVKRMNRQVAGALVASAKDCTNVGSGGFFAVAAVAREPIKDDDAQCDKSVGHRCFIQKCVLRDGGFLALGVPLVDPSIDRLPSDVVNWSQSDKISELIRLRSGGYLWFNKHYEPIADDPREGRRTSLRVFSEGPDKSVTLIPDCDDATVVDATSKIAVSCAREVAADNLLHEVLIFDIASRKQIQSISRCRNPKLSPTLATCEEESVGADGQLQLRKKNVTLK